MSVEIGQTISHYTILEKLGEGGMGVVYKALDTSLNREVALKFLPTHLTTDEASRKRFMVEAQAASALDHPNICTIHEINTTKPAPGEAGEGQLYICMAYYKGESLRQRIKKDPIPSDQAMNIFFQIAQGLKAAHEEKIIHRDIKPGNILITDKGEVKIVDFGLAKLVGMDLTKSTSSSGTAAYMSPEQIRRQKVDQRCDIWALGIVLYEMLSGQLPFEGESPEPMMYSIVNEEPESISKYLSEFPESLQVIIDNLLKKDPNDRYRDISDMLVDLKSIAAETGVIEIRTKSSIEILLSRKKTYLYGSITFLLIVLLLLIGWPYLFPEPSQGKLIAVLPLESLADDAQQEWFADGMTDALITDLAKFSGLRIISRTSAMKYKGTTKTPPEIAAELGVQYLVEASTIKMGDQVKISVRLIDALPDEYIWAGEYEREFRRILTLQGEISQEIANQIQVKLTPQDETRLSVTRPVNPETYEMYMKGMFHLNKGTRAGLKKGMDYFNQAVEIDSTEQLAHAGLSLGYSIMAHSANPVPNALILSKKEALKALELDDNLAEAHLALAMVRIYGEWDKIKAGESYRRTLELNPNLPLALMHYGYYLILMEGIEKGVPFIQQAMERDPLSYIYPAELAEINYMQVSKYDKVIEFAKKSLELEPNFPKALYLLGAAYAGKGMYKEAIEVQKKSAELSPGREYCLAHTYAIAGYTDEALKIAKKLEKRSNVWDTWCLAVIYSALGDDDKVFYWLEEAYEKRHPYIQWIKTQKFCFEEFYDDPRFKDLARRLNLPQ